MKMTLNVLMMMLTMIMKAMNTTLKMMADAYEMVNDITGLIKTGNRKKGLIRMIMILLLMKVFEVMISNTVNALTDFIRMITRMLNATDIIQIIEFIAGLVATIIIAFVDVMKNTTAVTGNYSAGMISVMKSIGNKTNEVIISKVIRFTGNDERRIHSKINLLADFHSVPQCY